MILIAFGSNIDGPWGTPRETVLRAAKELLEQGVHILRLSTLIETLPFGVTDQPSFINAVAKVETNQSPEVLMQTLHALEREAGRERGLRWGPRTLDLDLLDYDGLIRQRTSPDRSTLALPHPEMLLRDFVLQPIAEVAPEWRHPVTHQSAQEALASLAS